MNRDEKGRIVAKYDPDRIREIEKVMYQRIVNGDDPSTIITDMWLDNKDINIFMLLKLYRGAKYQYNLVLAQH